MILKCNKLYNLTQNPKINIITLEILREYYEMYLNPFIYEYEIINNKNQKTTIELRFDKEKFCHILGIESTLRYSVSRKELGKYKGEDGWDNIKSGILDFKFIKEKNKKGFKNNKSRYVFFYLIPKLVESPSGVLYNKGQVMGSYTRIDCELIFYDEYKSTYVHIGIKKDEDLGYYIPKTFLIEKITSNNDGRKYIENQQIITVNKLAKSSI